MTYKVDVPGRGAWTQDGGLLPLTPTSRNRTGYYRAPGESEAMIGKPYVMLPKTGAGSFTRLVVFEAVKVLQRLVGAYDDGLLGLATGQQIKAAQRRLGLEADGICGPATMRALFVPIVTEIGRVRRVPVDVLGGIAVWESGLDPAAVGVNGYDTGPCQINLGADAAVEGNFTVAQVVDPVWSLTWSATELRRVYDRWRGKTTADPWDIAVANHNSPRSAQTWAQTGKPPFSQDREDHGFPQIDEYVARARASWTE